MTATTSARELAEEIAAAHGGAERWRRFAEVHVRFSARGLAFWFKGQPAMLSAVSGRFGTAIQSVALRGESPRPWSYAADSSFALLSDVRRLMAGRRPRWTMADTAIFAATAMWTYLNLPFMLLDPTFGLELLPSDGRKLRRLRVRFPPALATHSTIQVLHVDGDGLIRRHDYTARGIGRWAAGSQLLDRYQDFGGILFATRRQVTPRLRGYRCPGPTLVAIEIQELNSIAR